MGNNWFIIIFFQKVKVLNTLKDKEQIMQYKTKIIYDFLHETGSDIT